MSNFDVVKKNPNGAGPQPGAPPAPYDVAVRLEPSTPSPLQPAGKKLSEGPAAPLPNSSGSPYGNTYNYTSNTTNSTTTETYANDGSFKQPQKPGTAASGSAGQQPVYPEAEVNYVAADGPPADGEPLYPPEETAANPNLKRFVKQGFKDIWAAGLFAALYLMTFIWGIVNLASYKLVHSDDYDVNGNREETPMEELEREYGSAAMVVMSVIALVVGIALAFLGLLLAKTLPGKLILIANGLVIVAYIVSGILMACGGGWIGLIVMLICAALQALWLYLVRSRIPFAAALLQTSTRIVGRYKGIFLVNLLLIIAFFVFSIFCGAATFPSIDKLSAKKGNDGGNGFIVALFAFIFLWTAQVTMNIMHVTTSGVVATWYYAGAQNMPSSPVFASFKRAITSSLGSICFGSLVVAVIQFLRYLVEASANSDNDNSFFRCVASCLLRCLENAVQYFNTYAFVHVAIYGCGYIEAARRTFALCKQCFFAAYFNDCLIAPTLSLLALVMAILVGTIFGLVTSSWVVFGWTMGLAWIVQALMYSAVDSAITALFVCFAEAPEALQASDPDLYAQIHSADGGQTHNGQAPPPTA